MLGQTLVEVTYERCSFTRGSDCRDFNGRISVFWTGGRLWEVVSHGLYNSLFLKLTLARSVTQQKFNFVQIMGLVSISRKYKMRKPPCQKSAS